MRMRFRQLKHLVVLSRVMLDDALPYLRDVEQAMEEVGRPVEVCRAVGDIPAEAAHCFEGLAGGVGEGADDGLGSGVFAAPMAGPSWRRELGGVQEKGF